MNPVVSLSCPKCGTSLPVDDINVSANIALCRVCGHAFSLETWLRGQEDSKTLERIPPHIKMEEIPHGLKFSYYRFQIVYVFFFLFSLIWNLSVWGIFSSSFFLVKTIAFPSAIFLLFFLIFALAGAGILITTGLGLFGRTELTLLPGEGQLFRGIGKLGRTWIFPIKEDTVVSEYTSENQSSRGIRVLREKIKITQPDGTEFIFGSAFISDKPARDYFASVLRKAAQACQDR